MSTVLNDRDAILQAATVRIVNPKNAWINLQLSAPGFHLNAAGQVDLGVVTVTADLVGLDDAVTFSAAGATLSNAVGRSVDVTYAGQTAILTAKVVSNGDEFKRSIVIPVLRDGASGTGTPGAPGARGAGHYYATGSTWSDVVAQAACPGSTPVLNDVVTISSSTYVMEKRWTGSAWIENGVVVNGRLIAPDSILASSIDARGLSIKDPSGRVILSAGSSLADQTKVNPNLVPALVSWPTGSRYGGAAYGFNAGNPNFVNGQCIILPPLNGNNYVGYESDSLGIPPNVWFTVSFDAHSYPETRDFCVDVYGTNVDLAGVVGTLTPTKRHFVFTDIMTVTEAAQARLRVFGMGGNSNAEVYNIKVEFGMVETGYCDTVITPANSGKFVLPNSIGNTQIGGDLYSTNWIWNSVNDTAESGWLLQRGTSRLYARDVKLTGATMGGAYRGWSWPAPGQIGYYVGPEGALFGNYNDGKWVQIFANGNMTAPGFQLIDRQLTLDSTILYNARIQVSLSATLSFTNQRNRANTFNYENFTAFATVSGAVGNLRYQWSLTVVEGDAMMTSDPSATSCSFRCRGQNITVSVNIGLVLIDEGSGAVVSRSIRCLVGYGNGA